MKLLLVLWLCGCNCPPGEGGGDGGTRSSPCISGSPRKTATAILTGLSSPFGIATDENAVYWTQAADDGVIGRANKDGSGKLVLTNEGGTPEELAADGTWLYYQADDQLRRVSKSAPGPSTVLASGYDTLHSHGLLADGSAVYFSAFDKTLAADVVVRLDPDGGNLQVLAQPGKPIYGLAQDAGFLYFAAIAGIETPTQHRVPKSGGMVETLQSGAGCFEGVCDGKSVYCGGDFIGPYRVAVTGGMPVVLCTLEPGVLLRGMVLLGDKIFVLANPPAAGSGIVLEISTRGGGRVLSDGLSQPRRMASDGTALFYTEINQGTIMKVTP